MSDQDLRADRFDWTGDNQGVRWLDPETGDKLSEEQHRARVQLKAEQLRREHARGYTPSQADVEASAENASRLERTSPPGGRQA